MLIPQELQLSHSFDAILKFLMDVNFCRFKNKIFDIMVIKSSRLIK